MIVRMWLCVAAAAGTSVSALTPSAAVVTKTHGLRITRQHNAFLTQSAVLFQSLGGGEGRHLSSSSFSSTTRMRRNQGKRAFVKCFGRMEEDDDDDEDEEPPEIGDVSSFRPPTSNSFLSYGWNKGRSSPATRKAMGKAASSTATIHLCTNCGSEFVQWMGRCPTCKEWNTIQPHTVARSSDHGLRPSFGTAAGRFSPRSSFSSSSSWLDGIASGGRGGTDSSLFPNQPVRVTDFYQDRGNNNTHPIQLKSIPGTTGQSNRIVVPNDDELNMVLGGGLMKGSLVLVGGEPGVGKSTLLLQMAGAIASLAIPTPQIGRGLPTNTLSNSISGPVWYVSGEENPDQIASRAARLGIHEPELWLLSETHADTLCQQVVVAMEHYERDTSLSAPASADDSSKATHKQQHPASSSSDAASSLLLAPKPPSLLIIDSIQTMVCEAAGHSAAAGGITQVRECVALFLRLAKSTRLPVILVGHVTKTGDVAGPRTVEHMVDAVLYLEGGSGSSGGNIRLLRASKNRFGSADEVGVYEMLRGRLLPVSDPSSLFLAHRTSSTKEDVEGSAIAIAMEGRRAMAVEVQALATPASADYGGGRRTVDGIATSRLLLLMGVLQKRCGLYSLARQDVYINVVGRVRLHDRRASSSSHGGEGNAADLAVALALVSSLLSIPVRSDTAFVGEIGLLGELRSAATPATLEKRFKEAHRMGFSRVVTPRDPTVSNNKKPRTYKQFDPSSSADQQQTTNYYSTTTVHGIEWIQCETLLQAITAGLVRPMPPRLRNNKRTSAAELIDDDWTSSSGDGTLDDGRITSANQKRAPFYKNNEAGRWNRPPQLKRQQHWKNIAEDDRFSNLPPLSKSSSQPLSSSPSFPPPLSSPSSPGTFEDLGLDEYVTEDSYEDDDDYGENENDGRSFF